MSFEGAFVKFVAKEDQKTYFANLEPHFASLLTEKRWVPKAPAVGTILQGHSSSEDLLAKGSTKSVTVERVRTSGLPKNFITNGFVAVTCSTTSH